MRRNINARRGGMLISRSVLVDDISWYIRRMNTGGENTGGYSLLKDVNDLLGVNKILDIRGHLRRVLEYSWVIEVHVVHRCRHG